jgi:hypothetical protein
MKGLDAGFRGLLLLGIAVSLLCAGCATHRIDWSSRIGTYTYDQAVMELGPPDKHANLTDGTIVAEWLTHRGYSYLSYSPYVYGYYPGYYGPWYTPGYTSSSPDYFLRLTFDPQGRLRAWKTFYK